MLLHDAAKIWWFLFQCSCQQAPSHLQIQGGPKMARAALRRRVIDWQVAGCSEKAGRRLYSLFGGWAGHFWPVQTPARRAIWTGQKWSV